MAELFLDRLPEVLDQMKAIGHLSGLRSTAPDSLGVEAATVTADDLNGRVLVQPRRRAGSRPGLQHIQNRPAFQVDQDRAVALPLALGPIINTEYPNRFLGWERLATQEPQEMSRTSFYTKRSGQTAPAFPAQRKADRTQGVRQLSGTTTTSLDERRHALAEDAAKAGTITTEGEPRF